MSVGPPGFEHVETDRAVKVDLCLCVFVERARRCPAAMSTLSTQILVSKYHSPPKGTRAPYRRVCSQGWGRESTRGTWNIFCQKVRNCSGDGGEMQEQRPTERGTHWPKLEIKKKNFSSALLWYNLCTTKCTYFNYSSMRFDKCINILNHVATTLNKIQNVFISPQICSGPCLIHLSPEAATGPVFVTAD